MDAVNASPGRVKEVITVGSSNILDEKASWSNWGLVVDLFAPGVNIASAWADSDTVSVTIALCLVDFKGKLTALNALLVYQNALWNRNGMIHHLFSI